MKPGTKITATVIRVGNRLSVELDMAEAAAALDDECTRLRERVAEVERERDAARAELAAVPVVGPAKDAPDEVGWWLRLPSDPRWFDKATVSYVDSTEVWNPLGSRWFKIREVQP